MNKVIDKGFRSCRFVSTIVKHPVDVLILRRQTIWYCFHTFRKKDHSLYQGQLKPARRLPHSTNRSNTFVSTQQ